MNLILFTPGEAPQPLPRSDRRAVHLLEVLHRRPGDTFDCGLINGPRGKGTLLAIEPEALRLAFAWGAPPPPPDPLTVLIGLPRPQTARDILRDATTLGVAALHFVSTEKSDPNYAHSTLWTAGEWRRHLIAGAEQAFDTRLPEVTYAMPLAGALAALPPAGVRLAFDQYEAGAPLASQDLPDSAGLVLAFGPERGWGASDRALLRAHGFTLVHLGSRVLRIETAVIVALTLVKTRRGSL